MISCHLEAQLILPFEARLLSHRSVPQPRQRVSLRGMRVVSKSIVAAARWPVGCLADLTMVYL